LQRDAIKRFQPDMVVGMCYRVEAPSQKQLWYIASLLKLNAAFSEKERPSLFHVCTGSSFGAGIAALMLMRGQYKLPTLLLAPAQDKMCQRAGLAFVHRTDIENCGARCEHASTIYAHIHQKLPRITGNNVRDFRSLEIVHGQQDDIIPIADTKRLYLGLPNCKVVEVDDIHNLNKYCLSDGGMYISRTTTAELENVRIPQNRFSTRSGAIS
jgi:hypothetical protein